MNETIVVTGLSNAEFLAKYAQPGRIGLAGGASLLDKALSRAQRHVDADKGWSRWAHAFVFQGVRQDQHHWVIESDLEVHRRHIRLGVQENRLAKFHNEKMYCSLAVMDFGLTREQINCLLGRGLELVATRVRYSIRELVGTLVALRHPSMRSKHNPLSRPKAFYCSAFVHHLFRTAGMDLAPGLDEKHTTPEDLWRALAPHTTYLLERPAPPRRHAALLAKIKRSKLPVETGAKG